jgi:Capsule assembly protein Wzi
MNRIRSAAIVLLAVCHCTAFARGVSPYLPLNLEPEIESQIERVLVLGDQPVMTRPIPAALVLDALPKACAKDAALCAQVKRYLSRFMHNVGIAHASIEGAASGGDGARTVLPDRYGQRDDSHWAASAQVYAQPNDYVLFDLGAVAYEGHTGFSGSLISLGFSYAQLDVGFRPHWFSPLTDSSMLMSTEAPTMPSVTLSNYQPFSRFGLHYELFAALMSSSSNIAYGDGFTTGHPRLAGIHLEAQPADGWGLGVSRLTQYGGGLRGGSSLRDLYHAFFSPSSFDNNSPPGSPGAAANQQASITSSMIFQGQVPFAVYFEYAGEDTSRGKSYLLGNSALSMGIHFPRLFQRFDFKYEITEWQNSWYVHNVYLDGLTNYGLVIGNWFGDQRKFNDGVGGRSQMASLGWTPPFGGLVQLTYRTLQNQTYTGTDYQRYHDLSLGYSRPVHGVIVGGEIDAGRDVFGENYSRIAGFLRYDSSDSLVSMFGASAEEENTTRNAEVFVDAGLNANRINVDLTSAATRTTGSVETGPHFAVGARRLVSAHSDLGTRVEIDQVQGHNLLGARVLDYRYRFNNPLALSVFIGAARYSLATPAYGIYYGAGVQWRNVFPGWDIGADIRYADSVARDHLLPSDPANIGNRNDSFYNILSATLSASWHF